MPSLLRQLISASVLPLLLTPAVAQTPPEAIPQEQAAPVFDLLRIQVDGNTVLPQKEVEKAIYPFLGPNKSIDDVEKARLALEAVYAKHGYSTVVVDVPEQDVIDNAVRLDVVEGTVERLKITGSRYYSLGKIKEKLPALAKGEVPNMPVVQAQLAQLAEESADRQITPVFRAGSTPGKTEVELHVKDTLPLHGSVELNGRNNESTTRSRLNASVRYDNLWQRFHSASLQFQISPEDSNEVEVWSGTYVMPTGFWDSRLAMYGIGISSNTNLGTSIGGLSVLGTGYIFGARLMQPLSALGDVSHSLTAGFDYKMFDQGVTVQGQDLEPSPINYASFLVGYDASLRLKESTTSFSTALHFSVRGLGNDPDEFENRRQNAKTNYAYLTSEVKHLQQLPYDLRVAARASGQIASSPLISNEQFALGGVQTVRGYFQTQQLGDDGINLSLELQSPQLKKADWDFVQSFRAHTFIDYGYLWLQQPQQGNPSFYRLAGAGAGLRLQLFKHWLGEVDWAYPLHKQGTVDVGNQRVDFLMAYQF
ncbi:MAG: ShlB/FhaC/HecB family hemolysin secretion/activation protein [Methylococcaceae bacterium]|nr:ShlB/FhaC/HecB family hemolysin secretion/activation protein [Methylococcaceae bacterium]